ncbi:GIY-YIG nuclease family protein [Brachybacterium halotolerans subsp. kimchii]|uniref:GIY-YIG nuclease family protein n=1 Tax=Brachybacterium halotolerans TaxID=2795215 RepID=UPI001E522400|nr:GIY-YIG nuclease family protein [Brachybacterium halotolerans]UEJ81828.1 GIY-YIG nuclease family protein [Brachybacterium halotolerans subsp. kimchii]
MTGTDRTGHLTLGTILAAASTQVDDVLAVRHTFTPSGLSGTDDLTPDKVLAYTRRQQPRNKVGMTPPPLWLVFIADGRRRSRFLTAYENHGPVSAEATKEHRYFDLRPSDLLNTLRQRLVVTWSGDTINWAKKGATAAHFPVVEISDPAPVPFPGFDRVIITFSELQEMVESSRYREWQHALSAVQGIYLITDRLTGKHYVGKADGTERILGRWRRYAQTCHGDNIGLRELLAGDIERAASFQFSILRVFGPDTPKSDVDLSEAHFKDALMSRSFGLNRN